MQRKLGLFEQQWRISRTERPKQAQQPQCSVGQLVLQIQHVWHGCESQSDVWRFCIVLETHLLEIGNDLR